MNNWKEALPSWKRALPVSPVETIGTMKAGRSRIEKIKRGFDPAYGYVVFERTAGAEGDKGFRDLLEILGHLELECHEREVIHDEANGRVLLVIRFDPGPTDRVMEVLFNAGLPEDIFFFVYGSSRSQ